MPGRNGDCDSSVVDETATAAYQDGAKVLLGRPQSAFVVGLKGRGRLSEEGPAKVPEPSPASAAQGYATPDSFIERRLILDRQAWRTWKIVAGDT
jgi:hypothetical protein